MKKKLFILTVIAVILAACMPVYASANTKQTYTVYDMSGNYLFSRGTRIFVGDEYVASDNKHYRVTNVSDPDHCVAQFIGTVTLPDITLSDSRSEYTGVNGASNKTICLYYTHTDESYIKWDGAESKAENAGILDIGRLLKKNMEKHGAKVIIDETPHMPHDSGAYRRSQRTASALLKKYMPAAIFDIHRDGVPNASEYYHQINGKDVSKVRIVVGRANQNSDANKEFAYRIKAVADKAYPGLIKDIFIGKGSYNQELSARSLIFEMGTHTITKDLVEASTPYLSEVVCLTLFGGTVKADSSSGSTAQKPTATPDTDSSVAPSKKPTATTAQPSATPSPTPSTKPSTAPDTAPSATPQQSPVATQNSIRVAPMYTDDSGSWSGMAWIASILVIAVVAIAVMATSKSERAVKIRRELSEITGGLFGDKRGKQ